MRSRRENHTNSLRQPEQATRGPLRATGATGLHMQLWPAPWHAACTCALLTFQVNVQSKNQAESISSV